MSGTLPNWSVRRAAKADLEILLGIESAWPTTPHWAREHFEAELGSERSVLCVLEERGKILGYASMKLVAPEAQVFNVAVRTDAVRRGVGKALLRHLHEEARKAGCVTGVLEVSERNAPALGLYAGFGYRVVGRRPKYYNDGATALLMEATL